MLVCRVNMIVDSEDKKDYEKEYETSAAHKKGAESAQ